MNKYQRVLNKMVKYDFETDKLSAKVLVGFRETRILAKEALKDFVFTKDTNNFNELLKCKNLSLKLLKNYKNGTVSFIELKGDY